MPAKLCLICGVFTRRGAAEQAKLFAVTYASREHGMAMSLKRRAQQRLAITLTVLAAWLLFSGSLRFWQGWLFLVLMSGFWTFFLVDLMKHDPQLLERRLESKETQPEQRLFQKLWVVICLPAFTVAGLDFRFGWSRRWLHPVPLWLIVVGQLIAVAGYWLVFWVMKTNSFAGSTIQVESGQRIVRSGPYATVRHPMYSGMAVTALGTPLALGSYLALPLFASLIPVLIFRLIHEEEFLHHALPGYAEYCEQTRFRLVPFVW
jgi:protein-S-isoprenylcysteine O-methyltransferase Ste14